jgi:hypothetical protein
MQENYVHPDKRQAIALLHSLQEPHPTVVALEGGPCGGKTTVLSKLDLMALTHEHDRPLVLLPEAATEHATALHASGRTVPELAQNDRHEFIQFETRVLRSIVDSIETAVEANKDTDAIIVADRADIATYVSHDEHDYILHCLNYASPPHLRLVDKIVFMPSLAQIDPVLYESLAVSNPARYESAPNAISTCNRNLGAVAIHPELSLHWTPNFTAKVDGVLDEILYPESEIEAKFTSVKDFPYDNVNAVIKKMTVASLPALHLTQSYHELDGQEYRLRRGMTGPNGDLFYHFAVKTGVGSEKHELRRTITHDQYKLLGAWATHFGTLIKYRARHLLPDGDSLRVLSADYYQNRNLCAIEIEGVTDKQAERFEIPGFNRGGVSARNLVQ